jgi:hypothetical protein
MTQYDWRKFGAMGGRVKAAESEAKAAALVALHASLRGRRTNDPGMSVRQMGALLADVTALLKRRSEPGRISLRALAAHCRVDPRTVGRWLDGVDWPSALMVRRMESWLRRNR